MHFGVAAANLPNYGEYSKMCSTQSNVSQSWAYACLAYGELAERRGDTDMGASIARSMQIAALKQMDDPSKLAAVTVRQEQARAGRSEVNINTEVSGLLLSTPAFFADYLNALGQQGETAARHWARAEAERLRAELPACVN